MEGLTLLEALCITKTGWTTEEERQLFDKASSIIEQQGKRLKLIYKKDKEIDAFLNTNLKTFSWSFNDSAADVYISQKSLSDKTKLPDVPPAYNTALATNVSNTKFEPVILSNITLSEVPTD